MALADAGHAPSSDLALWMYQNGPTVFGKDWDSSPAQLRTWAALVGKPEPVMLPSSYPQSAPTSSRSATQRDRPGAPLHLTRGRLPPAADPSRSLRKP